MASSGAALWCSSRSVQRAVASGAIGVSCARTLRARRTRVAAGCVVRPRWSTTTGTAAADDKRGASAVRHQGRVPRAHVERGIRVATVANGSGIRGVSGGDNRVVGPDCAAIVELIRQQRCDAGRTPPLLGAGPDHKATPLHFMPSLAEMLGVEQVAVKDEAHRHGLKAFKVLGVQWAVERLLRRHRAAGGDASSMTLTTMTDGNHGRAVAHVAKRFGCRCIVFVPASMVPARRDAIAAEGAEVHVVDGNYDDAILRVRREADTHGWHVVSDTAWEGYTDVPLDIMAGYTSLFDEVGQQCRTPGGNPGAFTHVFLQGGVGGFAAAGAISVELARPRGACACNADGDDVPSDGSDAADMHSWVRHDARVVVVEPTDADCLLENALVSTRGVERPASSPLLMCRGDTESVMSGLNCGEPSIVAWPVLRDLASAFVAVGDEYALAAMRLLHHHSSGAVVAGESGAAGLAGLMGLMGVTPSDADAHRDAGDGVDGARSGPGADDNATHDHARKTRCALVASTRAALGLGAGSRVLLVSTEGDTDPHGFCVAVCGGDALSACVHRDACAREGDVMAG